MAYSQAQNKATQKYITANLEEVRFRVKKGGKSRLQEAALAAGVSMARYIADAVNAYAGAELVATTERGAGDND